MASDNPEMVLPEILRLSVAAGEAIMQVYNSPFSVEYKEDNSPLTLADKLSHEIIATGLKKNATYPIISEEMPMPEYKERSSWKTFWLVDPLDGTKEFIKHNGEFTVNIALIDNKQPVAGIIYLPVQRTLYFAVKGKGAYRVKNVKPPLPGSLELLMKTSEKLPAEKPSSGLFTIVASRSHSSPETESFMEKQKEKHGAIATINAGSSIKFCLVAEGKADVYPRFAPTMEWDTAAGQCIAEEAGKKVVLTDGETPLAYNKESLVNTGFIVI